MPPAIYTIPPNLPLIREAFFCVYQHIRTHSQLSSSQYAYGRVVGIIRDQPENPVGSSILLGALGPLRQ